MRRHLRTSLLCLLATVLLAAGTVAVPGTASAATRAQVERRLVAKINASREAHGLRPLRVRDDLRQHARAHSGAMLRRGELFHTHSFGVICCWRSIGENVAYGYSARSIHRMLMHSPGHRANILSANKRHVGVGVRLEGDRIWVTEVFRQPR